MFQRPILMNEADGSPGGGSQPTTPADPAANQGAPAVAFSLDDIKAAVAQTVAEKFAEQTNGFFANARKAGLLDKSKPAAAPAPTPAPEAPAAPSAPAAMTATEVQTLIARERAFSRATAKAGLTAEQEALVEQTYRAVNPPDPYEWASTFINVMGLGQKPQPPTSPTPQAPNAPAPLPPAPGANFSDKGPAASSAARDPLAILQNDPRKATMDDFRRLVAKEGQQKALRMWSDNVMAFLQTVKVKPDGRR